MPDTTVQIWFTPEGPAYRDEGQPGLVLAPLPLRIPLHLLVEAPFMDAPVVVRGKRISPAG